jgi:hypothetical protein
MGLPHFHVFLAIVPLHGEESFFTVEEKKGKKRVGDKNKTCLKKTSLRDVS